MKDKNKIILYTILFIMFSNFSCLNAQVNWQDQGSNKISINKTVKIGNVQPNNVYSLIVDSSIVARDLFISLSANWADFVFEKDYKLPETNSIKLQDFWINKKSEIDLSESLGKSLQTIEELFLHMIEDKKRDDILLKKVKEKIIDLKEF